MGVVWFLWFGTFSTGAVNGVFAYAASLTKWGLRGPGSENFPLFSFVF